MSDSGMMAGRNSVMDALAERSRHKDLGVKQATYKLTLRGQTARVDLVNKNICGGADDDEVTYDLEISAQKLDHRGFVVDYAIADQIEKIWAKGPYVASCEMLASGLVVFAHLHVPGATSIAVTVYNRSGYVEIAWTPDEQLPPMGPRLAGTDEIEAYAREAPEVRRKKSC